MFARAGLRGPRGLAWQALAGFLLGYLVLHPASMVVFRWLDPRLAMPQHAGAAHGWWGPVAHSFHVDMLPMGLAFGAIGATIATAYGYYRVRLAAQRDRLAEQADLLRLSNRELARLELANRRTTQFMAHDFKTSLGCVAGFAAQLLDQPELRGNRAAVDALTRIRRQAHAMLGNVADFLEFSRVREGGQPRKSTTSVTGILEEAIRDFSLPAHTERVTLGEAHAACPPLWADPRLLGRTLANLTSNAIKHNGPGTRVTVDACVPPGSTHVLFWCRDDGAGIPSDVLPHIFADFTTTGDVGSESSGLGLAFCRTVVEAHGGRIWCETSAQGSEFRFTIPLTEEHDNE